MSLHWIYRITQTTGRPPYVFVVNYCCLALGIPRQPTAVQPLIGEFETAGMFGISLVAELSTDHSQEAVCMISAWIFSETVGGMKFKFGEEIEQQLTDR